MLWSISRCGCKLPKEELMKLMQDSNINTQANNFDYAGKLSTFNPRKINFLYLYSHFKTLFFPEFCSVIASRETPSENKI